MSALFFTWGRTAAAWRGVSRALRSVTHTTITEVSRAAVRTPLSSGGFLGASVANWVSTSPSLLPRTWWSWAANIALSQTYGYATGYFLQRAVRRSTNLTGIHITIEPKKVSTIRTVGAGLLVGITAYSWVRGVLRQREISVLVKAEPKNLATHIVGGAAGVGLSVSILMVVRVVRAISNLYRMILRPYLPTWVAASASVPLAIATAGFIGDRVIRGRLLERALEKAEAANRAILPGASQPSSPLRSGSAESYETWRSLGAQGRRIVSGGSPPRVIEATLGQPVREPIRVYAGKAGSRSLAATVDAVIAELDRTDAWDRSVLVLFTGTGTGWLQEWSLSAIEYLTSGDCATASLQYSVYSSALSYLLDRQTPLKAGRLLFEAVNERVQQLPEGRRPLVFVAGESLGSWGGNAAFDGLDDMIAKVDGAVWTGTPGFTPAWLELTARARPGSPAIAPIVDDGSHIRVVTRTQDLERDYWGGIYARWEYPRVVYAQHPSDPVSWWWPSMLWKEPRWLQERVGHDVSPAVRWFPWITFWQIAADMPLSNKSPGGHGHAYHEEMVPIWAAVLGKHSALAQRDTESEDASGLLERITHAISATAITGV